MRQRLWFLIASFLGIASVASAVTGPITYHVTVDTSSIAGTTGSLDFNFNPGPLVTQSASLQILNFISNGSLAGSPSLTGDVSGGPLPTTLTFDNGTGFNDYFEGFTFGTTISFDVSLYGPALSAPDGVSTSGSTFAFSMFSDAAGTVPVLTTDTNGFAVTVDVNLDGTTTVTDSSAQTTVTQAMGGAFEITYAANLLAGDGEIDITNTGDNGAPLDGPGFGSPAGNICANVYAFSSDEQLISCCSCMVTPNGLVSLSIDNDILANTATGARPSSVVIALLSTLAGTGGSSTTCVNSAATPIPIAPGLHAWRTALHAAVAGGYTPAEIPFAQAKPSEAELASLANRCTNIIANSSGSGTCNACKTGGLGAAKQ